MNLSESRMDTNAQSFRSATLQTSLSPQREEGMRVRGGSFMGGGHHVRLATFPPLTPTLSPLRGEGEAFVVTFYSSGGNADALR